MAGINVPIGPATVEYGDVAGGSGQVFDITKGGVALKTDTTKTDITVDQYGDTIVKSITKGSTVEITVPFALHDLDRLEAVIPNSTLTTDGTDPSKKKLEVNGMAGYDMLANSKLLVIKPTDPNATANDWVTVPLAGAMTNIDISYDSDNERVYTITFVGYPDLDNGGLLYILGDQSATA